MRSPLLPALARMGAAMLLTGLVGSLLPRVLNPVAAVWLTFGFGAACAVLAVARYPGGPWLVRWPFQEGRGLADQARYVAEQREDSVTLRGVRHLDGVPWCTAPVPRRFHACWIQTEGVLRGRLVHRCACGAIRVDLGSWSERNQRRDRAAGSGSAGSDAVTRGVR